MSASTSFRCCGAPTTAGRPPGRGTLVPFFARFIAIRFSARPIMHGGVRERARSRTDRGTGVAPSAAQWASSRHWMVTKKSIAKMLQVHHLIKIRPTTTKHSRGHPVPLGETRVSNPLKVSSPHPTPEIAYFRWENAKNSASGDGETSASNPVPLGETALSRAKKVSPNFY